MSEFEELIRRLAAPSAVLSQPDIDECHRLSYVLRSASDRAWHRTFATSPDDCVLTIYMSDGWGADVRSCTTSRVEEHLVLRRGKLRHEFLLQRGLIKQLSSSGAWTVGVKIAEPIGLCHGRGAWHFFEAACNFTATPRVLGATGLCISCYLFDGALYSSLQRHLWGRHELYYSRAHGFDHGVDHEQLWAMDWVLPLKCISHACSNSVVWGLKRMNLQAHTESVHISLASLLNARTALHSHVGDFLARHLRFSEIRSGDDRELTSLWTALHVEPHMTEILVSLDLHWDGISLNVDIAWEQKDNAYETITGCMLYLLRWLSFSETRWARVGPCARMWLCSLMVGIDDLWALVMEDTRISKYHLSGYSKLDRGARLFLAVSAFSSLPAESTLMEIFEDDRYLRRAKELWETAASEVEYLANVVPQFVWDRIAAALKATVDGSGLRSEVLQTAHITLGYLWQEVFAPLKQLPLSLTQGDTDERLDMLAEVQDTSRLDPLSKKIRYLMDTGFSRSRLLRGITLLKEVPGTTNLVEQNHASSALLMKYHQTYTLPTLCSRSVVSQASQLLGRSRFERRFAVVEAQVEKLQTQARSKCSARNAFFGDLVRRQGVGEGGSAGQGSHMPQQALMQAHSDMFKRLPKASKRKWEGTAAAITRARSDALIDECDTLRTRLSLDKRRRQEQLQSEGLPNHTDSFRFDPSMLDEAASLYRSLRKEGSSVISLKARKLSAPKAPPEDQQQAILEIEQELHIARCAEVPWWCKYLCAFRDHFRDAALVFKDGDDVYRVVLCLFLKQKPVTGVFLELQPVDEDEPFDELDGHPSHYQRFACDDFQHFGPEDVAPGMDCDLFVLRGVRFCGRFVVSVHEPVPFEVCVAALGHISQSAPARQPRAKRQKIDGDMKARLMAEFPWLTTSDFVQLAMQSRGRRGGGGGATAKEVLGDPAQPDGAEDSADDDGDADVCETDEDDIDEVQVADELKALREAAYDPEECEMEFFTRIMGGAWTAKHKKVTADAVVALPRGGSAREWCTLYGWPKQMAVYYSKYGQFGAHALAREWCQRAQYYYTLWAHSDDDDFKYSDLDLEGYQMSLEWLQFLTDNDADSECFRKGLEINKLFPSRSARV